MTQEEQIRLYRLMEKLNWFFHQEMHYLDRETAENTARECYPEIREFTYDILSVSYTHLDVYKRQGVSHAAFSCPVSVCCYDSTAQGIFYCLERGGLR